MRKLAVLFLCTGIISCSENAPNSPVIETDYDNFSWSQIALQDTIVFDLTMTASGEIYAFTGLEVYYSNTDSELEFNEIVSLRNRRGFHADPETGWLVSILDSTLLYSSGPRNVFSEEVFDSTIISSSILDAELVYMSSSRGDIFSFDLGTQAIDTLYDATDEDEIRLISKIDDRIYLRKGSQIVILDTITRDFSTSGLPTTNINGILSSGENELLFAATKNQKILKSEDGGENWNQVGPAEIAANSVTDLLTTDQGLLYSSFLGSGVYVSNNMGESWFSQTNEELDWNTYSVEWVPDIGLIAGTATGIYIKTDITE